MNLRTVPGEGGETGALLRARDWAATPLGPSDGWPEALKTLVSVMIGSAQPMYVVWGDERTLIYNDAYAPLLGARHPGGFGRPFGDVWWDVIEAVGPILDRAFAGRTHHQDDLTLRMERNGHPETAHFSFSFTSVRNETGAVRGVLCVCQETTRIVNAQRRDAFRAELGDRLRSSATADDVMRETATELARHLGADGVGYSDVDMASGNIRVLQEWRSESMPSVLGEHRHERYGWIGRALESGDTVVITDAASDHRNDAIREVLAQLNVAAAICAPILRDGRLAGAVFVHSSTPRAWTPDETSLVEEVAARTWSAVYRRRAETALREREARLRLVQAAGRIGHFDADLLDGRVHRSPEYLDIQGLPADWPLEGVFDDAWKERLHPDDRAQVEAWLQADLAGGAFERRYRIVRPSDGAVRHILNRGRIDVDESGRPVRLLSAQTDVTEEVEADAALREQARRLALALDAAQMAEVAFDVEDGGVQHSDLFPTLLGYPAGTSIGLEQLRAAYHPDDRARVIGERRAILEGDGRYYVIEHRIVRPDGAVRWLEGRGEVLRDDKGAARRVLAVYQDVTDRREAEEAVRRGQAELLLLTDALPVLISYVDKDERYRFNNRAYEEWFGVSREDMYGRRVREVVGESAYAGVKPRIDRVMRGERFSFESRIDYRTAGWRDIQVEYVPRLGADGSVEGFYALVQDVGERRKAEAALRESERRFRAAVDAVSGILWTNDAEGRMVGEQPGWAALTGQTREEYQGHGWAAAVHPDDAQPSLKAWLEAVREQRTFVFEHRVRTAAGEYRLYAIRAIPVVGDDGGVREWVGVHTDVTEQRDAEEALRASAAALRESEEHYRSTVELNPQVAWTATPDGQLDRVAERWRDWTGTSGLGDSWGQGLHPDDLGYTGEAWARSCATGEPYDVEHRVRRVNGDYRWARSRAFPRRDEAGTIVKWYGTTEDVHDRKTAELASRASEERFRDMADAMPQLVWIADDGGQVEYYNARAAEYRGLSRNEDGSWRWNAVVHPDDLADTHRRWAEAVESGEGYSAEHRLQRADGDWAWHVSRAVRRENSETGARRWYGTATDIHALKSAEAALRESETRFRNMADHAPVMMWVTDESGYCTYLNEAWYEFTGQTSEAAEGFGWLDATHPEDKERAGEIFLNANARQSPFRLEYRLQHRDGDYRWCIDAASPRFGPEGEFLGYIGSVFDIQDRRAAEERVRDSEARLRTLTNSLPAFVWFATPDGALQYLNDRWYEYTGQTPETALPNGWAEALHPDDAERTAREWASARASESTYEIEARYRRNDGVYRWYVARAVPLRDDGVVTGWFGTSTDIHDRRTAENALQQLNETLEHRVQERTRELIAAEEALRQAQKLEAIGQLTGGVAHDFNNLLTVIRSSADLLRRRELTEERRRKYVDAISDTADRAAKLTGQLLAFARRQALKPEVFDAAARVDGVADMLRTVIGARVTLEIAGAPDCYVEADLAQFETALVNMAVNARDAMDGEGRLFVTISPDATAEPGRFVAVTVQDSGPGVPPDVLARIFEPFFTTKALGKGTGLGLSQVYGFAKQSGGEITVRNVETGGAAFTLHLPRATAERAAAITPRPRNADSAQGQGRILVVEDNAQVGEFATQLLSDLGYLTTHVPDAQTALQRLERDAKAFDIVFSDVVMPGMGGVELGRTVRDLYPHLPVVLTSGYSHVLAEDARHGFPLLNKPYSVEELSRVLRRALARG